MRFSKENIDPKKEPVSRASLSSSSTKKKIYWQSGERSSKFAFLKHWAALSTLISGVIAMIAVTIVFYRENTGTFYKSKFQSPITAEISSTPLKNGSEISLSAQTESTAVISTYDPSLFSSDSQFSLPESNRISNPVSTTPSNHLITHPAVENAPLQHQERQLASLGWEDESEELIPLVQREALALHVPEINQPAVEAKLPSDYFSTSNKSRWMGRIKMGAELGLGLSAFDVKDARATDSQVVSDVKVKPELSKSYGLVVQAEVFKHFSVGTGYYQNTYTSEIIPRLIPDTTGGGITWPPPPPPEGEEGEHEEHNEHGEGEHVIQFADGGYDVITNTGVTHLSDDMDADLTILKGSKEYFTYFSVPVQLSYAMRFKKFIFEIGSGINYNQLKTSFAQFSLLDDNKYSTQKSEIIGLKTHYFSQSAHLGIQYKLSYRLSIGASFKCNYALSNMNEATPFNTRVNSWTGMAGVYYNF